MAGKGNAESKAMPKRGMTDSNKLLLITIIVFVAMYAGAMIFLGEGFLKVQTFCNLLNNNAALIITACGLSIVMITGGIDISVGGVVALVSMSCAVNLDYLNGNIFTSIMVALGIGLAFGIVQGFLVAYLDIQPFIVSLAGMFFARGMTTIVHSQPFNVANEAFQALKNTRIKLPFGSVNAKGVFVNAYVEIGVVVAIAIVVILFCVLRWMKLGRSFYAVGGNQQSALMLGINVKRTRFIPQLLRGRRKSAECSDAGNQCKENTFHRAAPQRSAGRNCRICVLYACWFRFTFSCLRHGDERHRNLYHRRYAADRRCGQHFRNFPGCSVPGTDPEYRVFHRSGSGLVDRYHRSGYALPVPGNPECDHGSEQKEESGCLTNAAKSRLPV